MATELYWVKVVQALVNASSNSRPRKLQGLPKIHLRENLDLHVRVCACVCVCARVMALELKCHSWNSSETSYLE